MDTTKKEQVRTDLTALIKRMGSQNKAANFLRIAPATLSQIMTGKWELISDEMWRALSSQVSKQSGWVVVETRSFRALTDILEDAQEHALVFAVTSAAGSGKSATIKAYTESGRNVYWLSCNEFWNRKCFMQELLASMGKDSFGATVGEMMGEIVKSLKGTDNPLIILDEADKLSDQVLYFFISLYNQLEDACGIVMSATNHLEKRIMRGLRLNKKGYQEIYSRVGRKFIQLPLPNNTDIAAVCMANGVDDKATLRSIQEDCDNDLRRVKRKVHAVKRTVGIN